MSLYSRTRIFLWLVPVLLLAGCISRTVKVDRRISTAQLQTASLQQLIERINAEASKIKTLNATVDIATSVGGQKKGKITEYQEIRGYVLMRKPEMLRMIGLFPVVRNRAFDMVSDGNQFKLSIPPRNKFIVGSNEINRPSKQPLENLRPQHIIDALLLREIDPRREVAVLESGTEIVRDAKSNKDVEQATYQVVVIRRDEDENRWHLSRKIIFSRSDLLPHRQLVYDKLGNIATQAHYENFQEFQGLMFPQVIEITRPQEEYTIQLGIVKLRLNEPLRDDQFVLTKPSGAEEVRLDQRASDGTAAPPTQPTQPGQQPRGN